MKRLKRRVYQIIVDPPPGDTLAHVVSVGILVLIAGTVLTGILETVPALNARFGRFFQIFETVSVIVFSVEYVLRIWSCTEGPELAGALRGRLRCATRPMTLVDLAAILPFYLQSFLPGVDLRFIRVLRLLRLFRLFRIGGLSESFRMLGRILVNRKDDFVISIATVVLVLILASSAMFILEGGEKNTQFTSVPASMWWGMITITTIGYGDMVPMTAAGRAVGMVVAFMGVCILALPVAILGAGFLEEVERRHCGEKGPAAPPAPAPEAAPSAAAGLAPARLDESQLEWLAQRVATLLRAPPDER
jgi:voltage-gated potassium channel